MASPPSSTAAEAELPPLRPPDLSEQQVVTENFIPEKQAPQHMAAVPSATAAVFSQDQSSGLTVNPATENFAAQPVSNIATQNPKQSFKDIAKKRPRQSATSHHLFVQTPALPGVSLISSDGNDILPSDDDTTSQLSELFMWDLVGKFSHAVPNIQSIGQIVTGCPASNCGDEDVSDFGHGRAIAMEEQKCLNSSECWISLSCHASFNVDKREKRYWLETRICKRRRKGYPM